MLAEGHALRAAEGAGLDDEDLLARGVDPDAEAEQVAVPEDGVLAIDRETVNDALGEGADLALRHGVVLRGEWSCCCFARSSVTDFSVCF